MLAPAVGAANEWPAAGEQEIADRRRRTACAPTLEATGTQGP